jgi:hypothetical protein
MAPVMTNMPGASEHERAVDSELALLVSEYLQFHHCTGAHEVSKWLQHLNALLPFTPSDWSAARLTHDTKVARR